MSLGLARITRLLDELERPERSLRGALVAGTNGKGSVVALAGAVLREAGHTVGAMPKPHLVAYRERITVNGEMLSPRAFAAAVATVLEVADREAPLDGPPTEFEVLTAAGFLALSRAGVDARPGGGGSGRAPGRHQCRRSRRGSHHQRGPRP